MGWIFFDLYTHWPVVEWRKHVTIVLFSFAKTVNESHDPLVTKITEQLKGQCDAEELSLSAILEQVNDDKTEVTQHLNNLNEQARAGLNNVFNFLNKELRQDIPTGETKSF